MTEPVDLAGKIAIITGGGTGVGRATALALAREAVSPVLVGRRRDLLEETADLIADGAGTALVAPADVADEVAVADVVARTVAVFGGVDILVNAAAVGLYGSVERYPLQAWQQTMATNLTGVFLFCRAVLPSMKSR